MASSLLMRRTVSRLVTRHQHVLQRPTMMAFFSSETSDPEAKPAQFLPPDQDFNAPRTIQSDIPGVGINKTSTGLVGLAVEPNWYNMLIEKHQALLDKMEASDMPETAQYRIDVTKWCNFTLKAVKANPEDPEAVEEFCRMGQVEEMIEQCDDEMSVLDMYLEDRIWELVEIANPTVDYQPDPTVDPMGEDGDPDVAEAIREGVEGLKKED